MSDSSDRTLRRDSLSQSKDDNEKESLSDRDSTPSSLRPPSIRKNSTNDKSNPSRREREKDSHPSKRSTVQQPTQKAPVSPEADSPNNQELNTDKHTAATKLATEKSSKAEELEAAAKKAQVEVPAEETEQRAQLESNELKRQSADGKDDNPLQLPSAIALGRLG